MANLKIRKVNSLPSTLEASTMYLIKTGTKLIVHLTDDAGITIYSTYSDSDANSALNAILTSLMGQPNGIATLDANGNLNSTVTTIDGQNTTIETSGNSPWKSMVETASMLYGPYSLFMSRYTFLTNFTFLKAKHNGSSSACFNFVMPHDYDEGTSIHIKFSVVPLVGVGDVKWRLFLARANSDVNELYAPDTPQTLTTSYVTADANKRFTHLIKIRPGSDLRVGSALKITLKRDGHLAGDTYNTDILVADMEITYQFDKLGTKNSDFNYFT